LLSAALVADVVALIPGDIACPERDTVMVGIEGNVTTSLFAGRVLERQQLADVLSGSAQGLPAAVLVQGEAGVGKTRLVREVTQQYRTGGHEVLWGTCVHFGAASVPFAPVLQALDSWAGQVDPAFRSKVLEGFEALSILLPSLGVGFSDVSSSRLLPVMDTVLHRIAAEQPTVLVVDDLQWADASSLDVLAYLIAGFRRQNLALVATIREEDRPVGHPLNGWLSDMRRLPGVSELVLARLDPDESTQQIAALLGRPPGEELVADVLARSGGNAYFTELLVRDLPQNAERLPSELPYALREALLARWHSLSEPSRLVTRLLAVGGRPTTYETLFAVAESKVLADDIPILLREAVAGGVLQALGGQAYWFRHPLLAEVLLTTFTASELVPVHAAYADSLEASAARRPDLAVGLWADLAVHHDGAGQFDRAFGYSIRAAGFAHDLRASSVEAAHLARACALWESVDEDVRGSTDDRIALLLRTSQVGMQAGVLGSTELLDRALSLVDRRRQPLLASTLLAVWNDNMWQLDPSKPMLRQELLEAVRLTEPFPDSPERAVALAFLVDATCWDLRTREMPAHVVGHVREAVAVARRSGSPAALARALCCRAQYLISDHRSLEALPDVEESYRLARQTGYAATMESAANWWNAALWELGRIQEAADLGQTTSGELNAAGSSQWGSYVAARAAEALIELGRWAECDDLLRQALAARRGGIAGAVGRLVAARLAARRGQTAIARQHLDRALELVPLEFVAGGTIGRRFASGLDGRVGLLEMLVGLGESDRALEQFRAALAEQVASGVQRDTQRLLLWGARAAADLAQRARDRRDGDAEKQVTQVLDEQLALVEATPPARPDLSPEDDPIWSAYRAMTDAETGRCRDSPGQALAWERAASSCSAIGYRWFEAMTRWRRAQALVGEGATRREVAEALRQAHSIALELGAGPLTAETESLARTARINLAEPGGLPESSDRQSVLAALTPRERQVLGHLVAGRTNLEIARDLIISDKTVSVHVTNVLRKTGTADRIDAANLALRLGLS
jgi:DNA-binding CsgD family transcriptional regulator/tetratricopeptide (TPR) repeat protein